MTDSTPTTGSITADLREFTAERDWDQFHDPKSLLLALVGEVGELAELFQWVAVGEARESFQSGERQQRAAEEIADVATYLWLLADSLGIEIGGAVLGKLEKSRVKFPAGDFKGNAPTK